MHGSIGPSCAVAQLENETLTVWTHSQGVYPLRKSIAEMLRIPEDRVHCMHLEGSGCYGHNGADDVAADAALIARALPGRPVRVQWMRDQEHGWEPFGSAMVAQARASLDAGGMIANWHYEVWSNAFHASGRGRKSHDGVASGRAVPATGADSAAGRRRRSQRDTALQVRERARRPSLHCTDAVARLRPARARRLHERVLPVAVEIELQHETGYVRPVRFVAANDSGQIVNPYGIRNQIEGGIVQSASWTLQEAVSFDEVRITSRVLEHLIQSCGFPTCPIRWKST